MLLAQYIRSASNVFSTVSNRPITMIIIENLGNSGLNSTWAVFCFPLKQSSFSKQVLCIVMEHLFNPPSTMDSLGLMTFSEGTMALFYHSPC